MIAAMAIPGDSLLHRAPAWLKLLALAIVGTAVFPVESPWILCGTAFATALLYPLCGIPIARAMDQLRAMIWFLAIILVAQVLITGPDAGIAAVARIMTVIWAAALVTFTTPFTDMMVVFETLLAPTRRIGLAPGKLSFSLTLAVRFIPTLYEMAKETREAQKARGHGNNIFAVVVPLTIRVLRLADRVADAVDARGIDFDGEDSVGRPTSTRSDPPASGRKT